MSGKIERETWARKIDFLFACIGFSVGLGNVWRFPYLCYKNGGGAFLIPYFICAVGGGVPLFFLEVSVGQFMAQGGVKAWRICPILQGIGWTTTVIVFLLSVYYNIILAWAFYFVFSSFTTKLPWESCDNYWNTNRCSLFTHANETTNHTEISLNGTTVEYAFNTTTNITARPIDSITEFWENKVLNISPGIHELGPVKWDLALCLLLAWAIVFLCIWKGIKTSGKVMYFTATAPYIFIMILLIRNALLPGAADGLYKYMVPDFQKLKSMEVWIDAGTQIFYTYSISTGALTALGSYNKFHHNSYRDCILFAAINSGTSLLAGTVIFEVLGFMAHEQNISIDEVAESGPGLAFIAYPKAVSQMPGAPFWSASFFLMIILLGLDSQFVGVEGLITNLVDRFPVLAETKRRKEAFIGVVCLVCCLSGLIMVTNGGMYVFQLFDYYSGSRVILLVGFFTCVAIAWIYGINRFYDNLEMMFGFRINIYMKIAWTVISPTFCLTIFILSCINYTELTYTRPSGTYHYPGWAVGIGWSLASMSAICIPAMAVYQIINIVFIQGKPFVALFKPQGLKIHQLRPQDMKEELNCDDEYPGKSQNGVTLTEWNKQEPLL